MRRDSERNGYGHGRMRQHHLQREQLHRRAGRPGLHSALPGRVCPSGLSTSGSQAVPRRRARRKANAGGMRRVSERDEHGHGRVRQHHLQREQLRRRAGRPGLHSASVEPRWPSRFASTPWSSASYQIVTRRGCTPNERRDGQESATTVCAGGVTPCVGGRGAGGRCTANRVPCAGVRCTTMRRGAREATARGREALGVPVDEQQEIDGLGSVARNAGRGWFPPETSTG